MVIPTEKCFDILDVDSSVNFVDLKRAYHREARKHHPDCGGDVEYFKLVYNAYEHLKSYISDTNDVTYSFVEDVINNARRQRGFDNDILNFYKKSKRRYLRGEDLRHEDLDVVVDLNVTRDDFDNTGIVFEYERYAKCGCDRTNAAVCPVCGGKGHTVFSFSDGKSAKRKCDTCNGKGTVKYTMSCGVCGGTDLRKVTEDFYVDLPLTIPDQIRVEGKGHYSGDVSSEVNMFGDLVINIVRV